MTQYMRTSGLQLIHYSSDTADWWFEEMWDNWDGDIFLKTEKKLILNST